jgi:hypothetical protein
MVVERPTLRQKVELPQRKENADDNEKGRADLGVIARRILRCFGLNVAHW